MTHKQAKNQDQKRSVGLKDRVKTDGRMDMTDCSIFSANAVGNVITFNNAHNIIIDLRNVCNGNYLPAHQGANFQPVTAVQCLP